MTRREITRRFFEAVRNGNIDVARTAIDAGANVNVRDEEEMTPLHWAAESGDIAMVQLLIAKEADINAKDRWGCTPLRAAAQNRCTEIVQMLKKPQVGHVGRLAKRRGSEGEPQIGR